MKNETRESNFEFPFSDFFFFQATKQNRESVHGIRSKAKNIEKERNLECLDGVAGEEQRSGQFQAQVVQADEPDDSSRSHRNLQIELSASIRFLVFLAPTCSLLLSLVNNGWGDEHLENK